VAASTALGEIPDRHNDKVLLLMERGMAKQTAGDYSGSAEDWEEATALMEQLDYYSLSRGAASFIVNDRTIAFRGAPYERALLHAYAAITYFAMSAWDDAAVEARILVDGLADLDGFPDDPFSRYVAGFAFEMIRNRDSASIEYQAASDLIPHLAIDKTTGGIGQPSLTDADGKQTELVCFIGIGRAPGNGGYGGNRRWGTAPYAEILCDGRHLGRSHTLSTTGQLRDATEKRLAVLKAAKTATRIVMKEAIADAVEEENTFLGEALRLLLFAMEMPDTRRWETLPMFLEVARVPCPADMKQFTAIVKDVSGRVLTTRTVSSPITHRNGTFVSFLRVP